MKKKLAGPAWSDDEIDSQVREAERLRDEAVDLSSRAQAAADYLDSMLEDNGIAPGAHVKVDADLRVARQESYRLERRPDASQKALDAVFERVPYTYAKIYRESVPEPIPERKRRKH